MKIDVGKGRYTVIVHKESEDGYHGQCLELPGATAKEKP
jgi:predicted RNase H-like HicB family nuclease